MEQTSKKMRLQISPSTQRMLLDAPSFVFDCEERYDDQGEMGIELKGKGRQFTYWVNSAQQLVRDPNAKLQVDEEEEYKEMTNGYFDKEVGGEEAV